MALIHRHRWRITDSTILDAPFDKLLAAGIESFNLGSPSNTHAMTARPVIVTRRCDKCGTEEVRRV